MEKSEIGGTSVNRGGGEPTIFIKLEKKKSRKKEKGYLMDNVIHSCYDVSSQTSYY